MVDTVAKGMVAAGGVQLIAETPHTGIPIIEVGKFIIQAAIGVATIISIFKKKKEQPNP